MDDNETDSPWPTRRELAYLLDGPVSWSERMVRLRLLSLASLRPEDSALDAALPAGAVLRLAVYDWLARAAPGLGFEQWGQAVLAVGPGLDAYADRFAREAADGAAERSAGHLVLLDGRYLISPPIDPATAGPWFYDLAEGVWAETIDGPAETYLICDLGVLLLRLGAKLAAYRGRQRPPRQEPPDARLDDPDDPDDPSALQSP